MALIWNPDTGGYTESNTQPLYTGLEFLNKPEAPDLQTFVNWYSANPQTSNFTPTQYSATGTTASGVPLSFVGEWADESTIPNVQNPYFQSAAKSYGFNPATFDTSVYKSADWWNSPEAYNLYNMSRGIGTQVAADQAKADTGDGFGSLGGLAGLALGAWNPFGWGAIGAGMLGGGAAGLLSTGDIEAGLKGAALGGLGGAVAQGMSGLQGIGQTGQEAMLAAQEAGFSPIDLAQWGGASTTGLSPMLSNFASKQITSGVGNALFGGNTTGTTGTTGTNWFGGNNMATIRDIGSAISPFLSAYNTYQNMGDTEAAYNRANELITTPSADQQRYRTMLAQLMESPGSMASSPLYQAMADQGMNAVNRTAAAKGMLGSGNRLSELMKVGENTAAQYYFPQQQALASLSGVAGDQAARALAAQGILGGNQANMGLQASMLKDLISGVGVQSPEQQLINQLMGRSGGTTGLGGVSLGDIGSTISNWFTPTATDYSNWGTVSDFGQSLPYSDYLDYMSVPSYTDYGTTDWLQYL